MEPEKKPFSLNDEQRKAAYCENNAVVAAGAGSGKTMVLASRYVWLITEKKFRVDEILCLTFTKKAAAQMYRRIYLQLAQTARENSGEKGMLAQQALDEFSRARIQTLDSYCASVVRTAANRYGITPDFAIDQTRCEQLARDEALPFLIANRSHPALERLYLNKNPSQIVDDIFIPALVEFTHIDSPPDPIHDATDQFVVICNEWKKHCEFIEKKMAELTEIYFDNEKLLPGLRPLLDQHKTGKITMPDENELNEYFNKLVTVPHKSALKWSESHDLPKKTANFITFFSSLAYFDQRKGPRKDNPVKVLLNQFRDMFGEFSSLAVFCIQAGLVFSLLVLLSDLQNRFIGRKRTLGILTYSDVARLARKILLEQHDIRSSEKNSLQAIMIDEFQDNNELQKDLLFLLAENPKITNDSVPEAKDLSSGKLFFVGDEKQSVYRFRGADVSVFRKLKNELCSKDLPLKTNYRSAPLLIGAFNTIFGGMEFDKEGKDLSPAPIPKHPSVFAPELSVPEAGDSSLPLFEASYSPLRAEKKSEGKLTLCILDKQDSADDTEAESDRLAPVENEARYIAERIKKLLNEKTDTGETRYRPNDIAILFRSHSPQHFFEKHLMLLNIPYASEDLNGFFYGGPVDDIMSVLRLAAYPLDRVAYAQMLRSPFAGVSLPGLSVCLAVLDDTPGSNPFGNEPLPLLDDNDRKKYIFGQKIYQNISGKACTESITSLISELWYVEGYRYETMWNPKTAAFRDLHEYLFHLAAKADEENSGLVAFTDFIYSLRNSGERLKDFEIPLERPGAVHLMTVHKSKGLEFPVVFLCCCNKKSRDNRSGDIFSTGKTGITLNPPLPSIFKNNKNIKRNYFWERLQETEKQKNTAELRRLLYVGMTRAEKELYISGCLDISKNPGKETDNEPEKENFSINLKNFITLQIEKKSGQTGIQGDSIISGNTFFDLCLPAFGAHISKANPDDSDFQSSFFTIEEIPVYDDEYIHRTERQGCRFSNDQEGLNAFFETAGQFYDRAGVIETPKVRRKHIAPTSLPVDSTLSAGFSTVTEFSGKNSGDVFSRVDTILDRYAKKHDENDERFNSGGFGTVAHICVEALFTGNEPQIPQNLAGYISPADAETFLAAGKELALRFSHSPLGIIAGNSKQRKSEFPFRSLFYGPEKNEIFISGTIDLVFDDEKSVYVVDFKTDSQEIPGVHIAQMACYYRAASDLFAVPQNKECRVWLYYLRSGHAVEVTEQTKIFNWAATT